MNFHSLRNIVARILLFTAYLSCLLQWMWLLILALPPLIESGVFDSLSTPTSEQALAIQVAPIELSPLGIWLIGGVTIVILLLTVIVLIKIPHTILDTSEHMVEQATKAAVPFISHHRPIPEKKRKLLSRRLKLAVQYTLTVVPGLLSLILPEVDVLTRQIIITCGLSLMAYSLAAFLIAWLIEPARPTSQTRSPVSHG